MAATLTQVNSIWNTTAGNKAQTINPAVGDLIVVIAAATGVATTAVTDDQGGTYVQVDSNRTGFSTSGTMNAWARTTAIATATTVTVTATQTSSTGGGLMIYSVAGMSLYGASAIRSSGGQSTGTAATTPAPVLSLTPLSSNPVLVAIANGTNSATTVTPRTGYTEWVDLGYNTPTTGFESSARLSGETSATLTQGSTTASAFASIALELAYNTAPTVALNAPANAGTVATLTPQLTFTGTDADSDAITYEVQIDTVNTFDSVAGTTIDSNSGTPSSSSTLSSVFGFGGGQSVTGNGASVGSVQFYLGKTGAPTGNGFAKIYAHSGTFGTSSVPTGAALATSDALDVSTLVAGTAALKTITFSGANQIVLTNATNYVVTFEYSGGDSSNVVTMWRTNGGVSGNASTENTSSVWSASATLDFVFVLKSTQTPLLDKLSNTDAGFTDITNGAHTDPFTSGEQIGYTTPTLTNSTTYYWRVRGKDPSGLNTYGAWATTRSFTVSTGGGGGPATSGQFFPFF